MKVRSGQVEISHAQLLEWLHYDPDTGHFTWQGNRRRRGKRAGGLDGAGYLIIEVTIDGKRLGYGAHRLAWFYVHGVWPEHMIDHENTIKNDNRLKNLRPATRAQNVANTPTRKDNALGVKGVRLDPNGKYRARIRKEGRLIYLGVYDTLDAARSAFASAAIEIYGEFARLS